MALQRTTKAWFVVVWVLMFAIHLGYSSQLLHLISFRRIMLKAIVEATIALVVWFIGYRLAAHYRFSGRVSARHLAAGVAATAVIFPLAHALQYVILHPVGFFNFYTGILQFSLMYRSVPYVLYGTALAAGHALYYREALAAENLAAAQIRAQLDTTHARALQAQLEPHFLFNSLNSIAGLVRSRPESAVAGLDSVEQLLRTAFRGTDEVMVPLSRELEYLQLYLAVERMRFGNRVRLTVSADDDVCDAQVPALVLQPVVENAIRHGAAALRGEHFVCVLAYAHTDCLRIIVRDDGPGLSRRSAERTGLKNVRARLAQLFPGRSCFAIANARSGGCQVIMKLPL